MKIMILAILLVLNACANDRLNDRFMKVSKYISEKCPNSMAYDSLPSQYMRALDIGRDSAENLVFKLEGYMRHRECPE